MLLTVSDDELDASTLFVLLEEAVGVTLNDTSNVEFADSLVVAEMLAFGLKDGAILGITEAEDDIDVDAVEETEGELLIVSDDVKLGVSLTDSDDVVNPLADVDVVVLKVDAAGDWLGVSLVVVVSDGVTLCETDADIDVLGVSLTDSDNLGVLVSDVVGETVVVVLTLTDAASEGDRLVVSLIVTVTEPLALSDTVLLMEGDKLGDSEDVGVLVSVVEGDTDDETLGVSLTDSDGISEADDEVLVDILMATVSEDDKLGVSLVVAEALVLSETVIRELVLLDISEVLADIEGEAAIYGVPDVEVDTEELTLSEVALMVGDKFGVDVDVFVSTPPEGETDAELLMVVDRLGVALVVIDSDVLTLSDTVAFEDELNGDVDILMLDDVLVVAVTLALDDGLDKLDSLSVLVLLEEAVGDTLADSLVLAEVLTFGLKDGAIFGIIEAEADAVEETEGELLIVSDDVKLGVSLTDSDDVVNPLADVDVVLLKTDAARD